jgi:hypothetical protein
MKIFYRSFNVDVNDVNHDYGSDCGGAMGENDDEYGVQLNQYWVHVRVGDDRREHDHVHA